MFTQKSIVKLLSGLGLLTITGYAMLTGNETILPTALVVALLFLSSLRKKTAMPVAGKSAEMNAGQAAQMAITTFALVIAILSLVISLFLPALATHFNLTGLFDGDFVRVTINDAHEFAYATVLLLLLNLIFYGSFTFRQKSGMSVLLALCVWSFMGAMPAFAQEHEDQQNAGPKRNWELMMGPAGFMMPAYSGAAYLDLVPFPFIWGEMQFGAGEAFVKSGDGAGIAHVRTAKVGRWFEYGRRPGARSG